MIRWIFVLLLLPVVAHGQLDGVQLRTGDLLFQDLDCGPMCDAIEAVTEGFAGHDFSHIGLVYRKEDSVFIIEAVGGGVRLIPLDKFMARTTNKMYVGRLTTLRKKRLKKAVDYALKQVGVPYDDAFIYDNGKYYCSELVYDAFKHANKNKPLFSLEPMTFKKPGTDEYFPAWIAYYNKLGQEIPEDKAGINPGGISRYKELAILNK